MSSTQHKIRLGESWVVEGEDEDSEYDPSDHTSYKPLSPRTTPPRYPTRGNKSPEPEFVMPSLENESLDGSWAENSTNNSRRRTTRSSSKALEPRRRLSYQTNRNGSPEKRSRPVATPQRNRKFEHPPNLLTPSQFALQDSVEFAIDRSGSMLSWFFDIVGGALGFLKKPLTYLLATWMLFGILVLMRNFVTNSIYASLSPICRLPGTSLLNLPFCSSALVDPTHGPVPSVEFEQLVTVQSKFEGVLEENAGSVGLPLDMKRSEASIRDLRQLVKYSNLHSKNELVLEFDGFIETARIASFDLQKFNSHVGRAVDSVISTTRWTTRVLDGIMERDASRGTLAVFINDKLLAPFQPVKFTESILLDQYIQHTRIVEEEIHKLIDEAQAILMVLINLEDRLDVIHGIATREDAHAKARKEEILSELWSMVGGNKGKLSKMNRQLHLLQQVGMYRKNAYAHISGTLVRLQAISAGLEDLRERVGSPELLRDRTDIPLSVHIENIQRGVERLEEGRQIARKTEDEHIRRTLERGRLEGSMIEA